MLTKNGYLFRIPLFLYPFTYLDIDFGHILGNAEKFHGFKRDRAPFVLTPGFNTQSGFGNTSRICFCDGRREEPKLAKIYKFML